MNPVLTLAIQQRRVLKLRYYGHDRVVEPYAYGLDARGDALLLCYQRSGRGIAGKSEGWLIVPLHEVVAVNEMNECYQILRDGYRRDAPTMHSIFAQV